MKLLSHIFDNVISLNKEQIEFMFKHNEASQGACFPFSVQN